MDSPDAPLEDSTLQGLPVRLDIFEGPLDLLLHLIREHKVDIADIPIAQITEQYLQYLELLKTLNLDVAGEFLVMAATLTHIKSRMLLPVDEEGESGETGEDPREELVRQLQEYQKYKEAGLGLKQLEENRRLIFSPGSIGPEPPRRTDYPIEVSLFELISALKKLVESLPEERQLEIERDQLTVAEKIAYILERFGGTTAEIAFEDLFEENNSVGELIVTFLAILELMRLRMLRAWQAEGGGRILVADIRPGEEAVETAETEELRDGAEPETGEATFEKRENDDST